GTSQVWYGDLDEIAWYDKNSVLGTHPVAQKQPNGYGLFDMLGNVWQWNADWYDEKYYEKSPERDPPGPESSPEGWRSLRGGSYYLLGIPRVSFRFANAPGDRGTAGGRYLDSLGFRCVRELP